MNTAGKKTKKTRLLVLLTAVFLIASTIYIYFHFTHGLSLWRTLEVTIGFDSTKWFPEPNPLTKLFKDRKNGSVTEDELVKAVESNPKLEEWVYPYMNEQGFDEVSKHRVINRLGILVSYNMGKWRVSGRIPRDKLSIPRKSDSEKNGSSANPLPTHLSSDDTRKSPASQPSAKKQVAWKLDSDLYVDIVHGAKRTYSSALINKDDPLVTFRLLFLIRPISTGLAITTLEVTVLTLDIMENQSTEDDSVDATWKKGLEGEKFLVELTPGFRLLKLSQTDRMIKKLQTAIWGDDLSKLTKKELAEVKELALATISVHLCEALIPVPQPGVQTTDIWERSFNYTDSLGIKTPIDRNYLFKGHHNLRNADIEVISWKGSPSGNLAKVPRDDLKDFRVRYHGLD